MRKPRAERIHDVLLFLAATAFHFIVAAGLFFGLLSLWGLVLASRLRLSSSSLVILAAFILSLAGSGLIYKGAVKLYLKKTGETANDPLTKP